METYFTIEELAKYLNYAEKTIRKWVETIFLPEIEDFGVNEIFAIFMNTKRIQHGNKRGIELKKFDATTESLEYGELFLRFRKRDGFLVTHPKNNMVILKTKS